MRVFVSYEVGDPRQLDLLVPIAIPVLLGHDIWIVRMSQGDHEAERAARLLAGHIEELLARRVDDLVVEIDLISAGTRARLAQVVCEGRNVGGELGRVVVSADPRW